MAVQFFVSQATHPLHTHFTTNSSIQLGTNIHPPAILESSEQPKTHIYQYAWIYYQLYNFNYQAEAAVAVVW
jgi:hypothetical protein